MPTYFAIANRSGQWVYINSGQDPQEVYRSAIDLLNARDFSADDDDDLLAPDAERQLDTLRVVPEEIALQTYHVMVHGSPAEQ